MQKLLLSILLLFAAILLHAQERSISGTVADAENGEALPGASISLYRSGRVSGLVSNKDGRFAIPAATAGFDSLKFSMVGYHSQVLLPKDIPDSSALGIKLTRAPSALAEIIIKPVPALEIVKRAIAKITAYLPTENFESKGFYREIIKDRDNYFSVAEAVFRAQYFPAKENYKLQLVQGRAREDVSYTRLFEDFHPGGGPQSVAGNSFIIDRPAFLNPKKINDFNYKIDSLLQFDDQWIYSISFDQKPGIKEALEKGRLLITRDDYAVVRYDAENSALGNAYIKDLTGTDKVFAAVLNIDFKRKGWKRRVDFTKLNGKWLMSYAETEHRITYKQPKKSLDLDLTINIELLMTDPQLPLTKEIGKDEEWKRKNIIANLPGLFDAAYWGSNSIISPTASVNEIVAGISKTNGEPAAAAPLPGWKYTNRNFFVATERGDTTALIPIMKCLWEDDEAGGMIYKEVDGDFEVITDIHLAKTSAGQEPPDKGFQQAGIMIRADDTTENYLLLTVGTGGNPTPKLFFKKTNNNKSKTIVNKVAGLNGSLKLERKGNTVTGYFKEEHENVWKETGSYEISWLPLKVQLGLAVFAHFAGDGPKMKPDMQAAFSAFKIQTK